jgi:hypothetical protein
MNDDFLICSYSEDSHRHAILVDDGRTGILYLHAPSDNPEKTGEVEATCFAFNRVKPIKAKNAQRYRPNPPPIAEGYASEDAVCRKPKSHEWELVFSADGAAVVVVKDGEPWAISSLDAPWGFSKAIQTQGPWGSPWSDAAYEAIEWGGQSRDCT